MPQSQWQFDPAHSSIAFTVRHMMVTKVRGEFAAWLGTLDLDAEHPERSSVTVDIDAASIDTRVADRDTHLRSADFLDVANFPRLTFRSTRVERTAPDTLAIHGDLTIRGVTRPVVLTAEMNGPVKDAWGGTRAGFSARTAIERKDFGLVWNMALEAGGFVVGDRVEIQLEIEAMQPALAEVAA
jgi:polyisoprenoid-binding protein YceI